MVSPLDRTMPQNYPPALLISRLSLLLSGLGLLGLLQLVWSGCVAAEGINLLILSCGFVGGSLLGGISLLATLRHPHSPPLIELDEKVRSLKHLLSDTHQQLQASEERFRTSIETMLDCFGIYSAIRNPQGQIVDFRIEFVNQAACLNNQMTAEAQLGQPLCKLLPTHRESGLFDEYCQVVETGQALVKDALFYEDQYGQHRLVRAFDIRAAKLGDGFVVTWRDVTDRHQMEQELRQSEARLHSVLENMPVMLDAFDSMGNIVAWNQECERVTGYSAAEVIGNSGMMAQLYPNPTYWQQQSDQWQQRGDIYRNWEWDLTCKDGSVRTIAWSNLAAKFPIPGWATWGIGVDVTERKQTERSLAQANDRFRLAMAAINAVVYDWDLVHDRVDRSEGMSHLFGFSPQELEANSEWWISRIHPEDGEDVKQLLRMALQQQERYSLEYRVRNHWGEYVDVHDQGLILRNSAGNAVRVVGSTTDIRERKRAEAALKQSEAISRAKASELEAFMEAVPAGVWIAHDPQCHHVTPNRAACEMMRRSPNSVMTATPSDGKYPFQFKIQQHGQDVPPADLPMQRAGRTGQSIAGEFEFVFEDGDICYLYGKAVPVRYESGEIRGVMGAFLDITHLKQAEAALQQSEERLQLALQGARQGIWDWNFQQQQLTWDDRCKEIFGLSPDFPVTYEWHINALHPDDRERVMAAITDTLDRGSEFEQEYRTFWPDGSLRWVLARGKCYWDGAGQPYRMSGTVLDITAAKQDEAIRKQTEVSLRESRERLALALDAARIGSWDWDLETNEVIWSPYHEMIFGYEPGKPQRTYQEWLERIHPDDLEVVQLATRQAMEEKHAYACEYRTVWADGSIHWVSSYGRFHYNSEGVPIRMLGMLFDISDRKQAEAALQERELMFRTLADTMPQLFWVILPNGHHEYCNQRWYDYTGMTPEQAHGNGWQQMVHPDDLPHTVRAFGEALATGQIYTTENRLRRASDGEYRWHLSQALPMYDEKGSIVRWFGSSTDIHDQKSVIEERAQALDRERAARIELERVSRMKDEFLAVVSHELRSPLNAILGWSRLLRTRTFDRQKTEQALESIERNAQAQTQLIEDLLDISRIIRGQIRLDLRPTNLIPCIQAAMDTIRPTATTKSIAIGFDSPLGMLLVSGDPDRLQQIIWNLLSNAVKFTPEGGRVEVRLEQVEGRGTAHPPMLPSSSAQRYAQIRVIDSGKGIDPEFLPYVFERFRQEDATTTRHQGGLGLGLAIVRNLVELHGGTIQADSAGEGQGATFTVQFPLLSLDLQAHQANYQGFHRQTIVDTVLDLSGIKVLIVDDERDTREFLQAALEQYGAIVISAASAVEAWQFLQAHQPDILLSDVGMPDEDGFTLIRRIRSLPHHQGGGIPAAALTAYAREGDRLQALAAGFQMHIPKPIEPIQLLTVIVKLLEKQPH